LASSTKKREGKAKSSLRCFFDLIVIVIFFGVAVPSPQIIHRWRRINDGLGVSRPIDVCISRWRSSRCESLWLIY
jgi:hypothetical protein